MSRLLEIAALTDGGLEPTQAVQYCVVDPNGNRTIFGDQDWVKWGGPIGEGHHPDGRIEQRTITIAYGDWSEAAS